MIVHYSNLCFLKKLCDELFLRDEKNVANLLEACCVVSDGLVQLQEPK